jgi:ABC-type multidrug transport system ATPase subunit
MDPVLRFSAVSRWFGPVCAVRHLDLSVPVGSVTVVLGPNGAGKTTSFRLATGVLAPSSGTISVFGLDPYADGQAVRRRCGVVPPKPAMYDRLTGRQNLAYAARLYELSDPPIDELAERFGIRHALGQRVSGYSTGMRTRLALARSLLHDPELLLLDEPTSGLDPESAMEVRHLLFDMAGSGKTVVMSTHLLAEADGTADQIVLMEAGSAWEAGSPSELAARYWDGVRVRIDAADRSMLAIVEGHPAVRAVEHDGYVTVTLDSVDELPGLVAMLVAEGVPLTRVEPDVPTLERLYFRMRSRAREAS